MQATENKTFVLVHGTWHGGWMWQKLSPLLRAAGHRVFTPTCTGLGERSHLMAPDVDLDTHIQDIVNVIEFEELDRVVLIGHSFSGITITGVADRLRDRMDHLVYFDALVPHAERPAAIMPDPETGELPEWWQARTEKFIDGYQMDFWQDYTLDMILPPDDLENRAWARRRITPHPAGQWTQPLVLENGGYEGLPKTYIRCSGQLHRPSSDRMPGPALNNPDWRFIEFPYHRNVMMTHPQETAELLLGLI